MKFACAAPPKVHRFKSGPELTYRVRNLQADKVEESGSDDEDGSTSASDDEDQLEGDEGQAGRRSSAAQKTKAALEQLQGAQRMRMCQTRAFCCLHVALNLTIGH